VDEWNRDARCLTTYRRVCDFAVLDGYVEIDADEDSFVLEIEVCDGEFVGDGHDGEEMDEAKAKR